MAAKPSMPARTCGATSWKVFWLCAYEGMAEAE